MPPADSTGTQLISVDQATAELITQFEVAVSDQRDARVAAESAEAALNSKWGGEASATYRHALANWSVNLDRVRAALLELQGAMAQYSRNTQRTEDDNLQSVKIVSDSVAASASWT